MKYARTNGQRKRHNDTQNIDTKYNNKNATLRVHHANISNIIDYTDVDVIKLHNRQHFLQVGPILET